MKQIKKYILCACLTAVTLLVGEGVMWGGDTYYARGTITVKSTGNGTAYISKTTTIGTDTSVSFDQNEDDTSAPTISISATAYLKAVPNTNYHFVKWLDGSTSGTPIGTTADGQQYSHTFSITANSTNSSSPTTVNQDVYAIFEENFYATVTTSTTTGASGSASGGGTKNTESSGGSLTFNLTAPSPSSGYAFTGWTGTGITFGSAGELNTSATVSAATTGGSSKANTYTATANYKPTYVVHFHPHDEMTTGHSVTGSMADATLICDVDGTLPANTFVNTIKTTFDGNGGQLKNPVSGNFENSFTLTQSSTFFEWTDKGSPETTYKDKATINRSGLTELHLYAKWDNPQTTYPEGKRGDRTITTYNTGKVPGYIFWPNRSYSVTANWSDPFYASMAVTKTAGTDGTPTVDSAKKSSDYKGSNSGTATFALTAPAAKSGYHFTKWTGTGITFSAATSLTTNATVAVSSTAGESNAASYTATANYVQNTYYAALTATSGGNGTVTVDSSPKSTTTSGGDLVFNLTITPNSGYHLDKIEFTTGSGTISGNAITVAASSNYAVDGDNKAAQYAVKVTFAKDMYNAKLTTAISSISDASSSTAQVSSDNSNWYENVIYAADAGNTDVTFYVKATPAAGYKFVGWSTSNGSSTTVSSLGATGTYTVKSASAIGETNAKTLYAIFKAQYDIVINANCSSSSTDRIVFNVTGPANYRVSVPVGGSITLKDVASGEYTITPEGSWSWAYTVSPTEGTTSFDSENKSTHNFTVNAKSSTKKHDEVVNVIEP